MRIEKVPPDGGYGWIIVLANALCNFIVISLCQSFSLLFKEISLETGLSATEAVFIINLNLAFGMIMGVVNGVLIKMIGYRKSAILASIFTTIGLILTAYSTTFTQFIISYSLITSFGNGLNMDSHRFAINCYFLKNRSKAVSYSMAITGIGTILMPQVTNMLMEWYTNQHVIIILGALSANCFVAASVLQPLKWHLKTMENHTFLDDDDGLKTAEPKTEERSFIQSLVKRTVQIFDLDLLKDPIFVNLLTGLSLACFVELNLMALSAFILGDMGFTIEQIATFISVSGSTNIVFRLLAPYIGQFLQWTPKHIYMLTLILLILSRFCLLLATNYQILLITAAGLGVIKGVNVVFMLLVLPSYVPLEKLATATGLQIMVNGVFALIGGGAIGFIKDITGSYTSSIFVLNFITFTTVFIWTLEVLIVRILKTI